MQTQDVSQVLSDPLAQELMQSSIPARLAYLGLDGFPRAIPIGFHWNGVQFVLCTVPHAPKVSALKTNPKVAFTRSEEHTSELQSQSNLVCRLLLEKKKKTKQHNHRSKNTT